MKYEKELAEHIKTKYGLTKSVKSNWKNTGVIPAKYFINESGELEWDGKTLREWISYWGFTKNEICEKMKIKPFTLQRWLIAKETPYVEHQKELLAIQSWFFDVLKIFSSKTVSQWISEWETTIEIIAEYCGVPDDTVKSWIDGIEHPSNRDRNKLITLMLLKKDYSI